MTLRLKELLASLTPAATQADLARELKLSPAAIAQLINHGQWPKSLNQQALAWTIVEFLMVRGALFEDARNAFEEMEPPRANAKAPATPPVNDQVNDQECEPMLLEMQVLKPATRRQFGLTFDPFADVRSVDDMYVNTETRYVLETMYQAARNDGFLAIIGESGAGKSALRRALIARLAKEPVIPILPYISGQVDKDSQGKSLKASHIAEAIMSAVAPLESPKSSPEARWRQVHNTLKASHAAGFRHVVIIEEAHATAEQTLQHLRRMREEFEHGFDKLLNVILIGQTELLNKLSTRNGAMRSVAQRVETVILQPLAISEVEPHLAHRAGRAGKKLEQLINQEGLQAIIDRLRNSGRDGASQLYPLAISNLLKACLNLAAEIGEPIVTDEVVKGV